MSLEVKVILHPASGGPSREVANARITQVDKHEGAIRDYAVTAGRIPLGGDLDDMITTMTVVHGHDRELPVWRLLIRALEKLR